jgi:hypothetical protein
VEQLRESRDQWQCEAERLGALMVQEHGETFKKPNRLASKAWRTLKTGLRVWAAGDLVWHPPRGRLRWSVRCPGRLPPHYQFAPTMSGSSSATSSKMV